MSAFKEQSTRLCFWREWRGWSGFILCITDTE
ncbi:mCG147359 [Mus musculus]|nr:mCG147359 [Mus musculus]